MGLTLRLFGCELNEELGEHFFMGLDLKVIVPSLDRVVELDKPIAAALIKIVLPEIKGKVSICMPKNVA